MARSPLRRKQRFLASVSVAGRTSQARPAGRLCLAMTVPSITMNAFGSVNRAVADASDCALGALCDVQMSDDEPTAAAQCLPRTKHGQTDPQHHRDARLGEDHSGGWYWHCADHLGCARRPIVGIDCRGCHDRARAEPSLRSATPFDPRLRHRAKPEVISAWIVPIEPWARLQEALANAVDHRNVRRIGARADQLLLQDLQEGQGVLGTAASPSGRIVTRARAAPALANAAIRLLTQTGATALAAAASPAAGLALT